MKDQTDVRTIYILLTRSETYFSRLIHLATKADYTHSSIGFEGPTGPFYSFARKYRYLALPAGLVEEQVTVYRRAVPCCLYELRVSEETYLRVRMKLRAMYLQRDCYHYSVLGVLACWFNLSFQRQHHYFCSQFVAETLQSCGVVAFDKDTALVRPMDFSHISGLQLVSEGVIGRLGVDRSLPCPSEVVAVLPFGHLLLRACRFCVRRRR